jgi:hypothetical protein
MRARRLAGVVAVAAVSTLTAQTVAASPYVYKIKAAKCPAGPSPRVSTGFRMKGTGGIITALHGVAGCKRVLAWTDIDRQTIEKLRIERVDIVHDLAVLTSPTTMLSENEGLPRSDDAPRADQSLVAHGYPMDTRQQIDTNVELRSPPTRKLRDQIPAELENEFKARGSPDVEAMFLRVQGSLTVGYSGAPLLDRQGRVVGIASGGLAQGFTEIAFAVPAGDIRWSHELTDGTPQAVWLKGRVAKLGRTNPAALFAIKLDVDDPVPRFTISGGGHAFSHSGDPYVSDRIPDVRGFELGLTRLIRHTDGWPTWRGHRFQPTLQFGGRAGYEWRTRAKVVEQYPGDVPQTEDVGQRLRSVTLFASYGLRLERVTELGGFAHGVTATAAAGLGVRYVDLKDSGTSDSSLQFELIPLVSLSAGMSVSFWRFRSVGVSAVFAPVTWELLNLDVDDYHFDFAGNPTERSRVLHEPEQRLWLFFETDMDLW